MISVKPKEPPPPPPAPKLDAQKAARPSADASAVQAQADVQAQRGIEGQKLVADVKAPLANNGDVTAAQNAALYGAAPLKPAVSLQQGLAQLRGPSQSAVVEGLAQNAGVQLPGTVLDRQFGGADQLARQARVHEQLRSGSEIGTAPDAIGDRVLTADEKSSLVADKQGDRSDAVDTLAKSIAAQQHLTEVVGGPDNLQKIEGQWNNLGADKQTAILDAAKAVDAQPGALATGIKTVVAAVVDANIPHIALALSGASPIDSQAAVKTMGDLGALGKGAAAKFDAAQFADVVPSDPAAPFSGQGATGASPLNGTVRLDKLAALGAASAVDSYIGARVKEQSRLAAEEKRLDPAQADYDKKAAVIEAARDSNIGKYHLASDVGDVFKPTVDAFRNPLSANTNNGFDGDPSAAFPDATLRARQAELLLARPISTIHGDSYGDQKPTRGEVIDAAAKKYRLDPAVVAGVILHEQRDQSKNEDLADFGAATLAGRDNSIGLGQILMSTALKNNADLLSDTVDKSTREGLTRNDVARLLTSDEHNIFATARYLRQVADQGARVGQDPHALPNTRKEFAAFDSASLRGSRWNADTIAAVASEYTSKPWNDEVIPKAGYPSFVTLAVNDVRRVGG